MTTFRVVVAAFWFALGGNAARGDWRACAGIAAVYAAVRVGWAVRDRTRPLRRPWRDEPVMVRPFDWKHD